MSPPLEFKRAPEKSFELAVVGGGIGGLILTLSLLSHGVAVTLYEAAPRFGEIGAGVSFGPNAVQAMKLISPHIQAAFEARGTHNQSEDSADVWFSFRYGEDCGGHRCAGEKIASLMCDGGHASVHRAHFLDELVKLLPDGIAKFGYRATNFETADDGGVIVQFQNGEEAKHDGLIACDGIKSRLRSTLLGHDHPAAHAVYSGKYAYRGLIPMAEAKKLLGVELAANSQMYLGRHGHVLTFPIEKGKTMNVVAFASSESWDSDEWVITMNREDMEDDFSQWGQSVHNILSLMHKTDVWALFNHPEAPTFYRGRVALLGDAAHASTPHLGSGAGMAIEDVYILGSLLARIDSKEDIEGAFMAYDAIRRPRGTNLVKKSREQGMLYDMELVGHDPDQLREELGKRTEWVWGYDIRQELE